MLIHNKYVIESGSEFFFILPDTLRCFLISFWQAKFVVSSGCGHESLRRADYTRSGNMLTKSKLI